MVLSALNAGQANPECVHKAVRVLQAPTIDGRLDEDVWSGATAIRDLVQTEPDEGEPATELTQIRILYDENNLYIGAVCQDSNPEGIVATEMRRDAELEDNDFFEIFIDTYHDHRNAFYFIVNPLGAKRDAQIRDGGVNVNWNWDGLWRARARRNETGWVAEIAIPFYTLRFEQSDVQTWGINFGRHIARKREENYWSPVLRNSGFFGKYKVDHCGHLTGLENLKKGNRVQLMPYVIGGGTQGEKEPSIKGSADIGFDLKYRLSSNLTADVTVNTDFAQVEADQEQFNITRFSLYFPEKRSFFLEGADIFRIGEKYSEYEQPTTLLFFSRTIGLSDEGREIPVLGGMRVTGKTGPYDIGVLNILTNRIYSTEDPSRIEVGRTNHAVVRLKRDFLEKSTFGVMYLSRNDLDSFDYNRVIAFDFNLAFGPSTKISGYAAKSDTPHVRGKDWMGNLDFSYNSDFWVFEASYLDIGENFNSEMGYILRKDIRKYKANIGIGPRPQFLNLRKSFIFNNIEYIENHSGQLESRTIMSGTFNIFQNGSVLFLGFVQNYEYLTEGFEIKDDVYIPQGVHKFNMFSGFYESDKSKKISLRTEVTAGGFYEGNLFRIGASGMLKINSHLNLEFILDRNQFDLPTEGGEFSTNIAAGRIIYAFTPDLFAKVYVQWNSTEDLIRSNFLLRWIYKPGANIYLIYNEAGKLGAQSYLIDRIIMLKIGFLFNY